MTSRKIAMRGDTDTASARHEPPARKFSPNPFVASVLACLLLASATAAAQQRPSLWSQVKNAVQQRNPQQQRAEQRPPPDSPENDIRELQQTYGERFRTTPFPGIYEIVRTIPYSPRTTAPILVTRKAEFTFNNGKLGAQRGSDGAPLSLSEWGAVLLRWQQSIRVDQLLQFGGEGPLRMIVLSAFDCPYSQKLETGLNAARIRYAVVPSTIGTKNQPYLRDIHCSATPSTAWTNALRNQVIPPRAPSSCAYDADYFRVLDGLMGGSKPNILFADGSISRETDVRKVRAKLTELEATGAHF